MEPVSTDLHSTAPELGTRDDVARMRERLIIAYLDTVRHLALRIHERLPGDVSIKSLYFAGIIGLVDAVEDFDPLRQIDFSVWAKCRVHRAIVDSLRLLDWGPCELRREAGEIEQMIEQFTIRMGRPPSGLEIARQLNINLGDNALTEEQQPKIVTLRPQTSWDLAEDGWHRELFNGPANDPLERNLRAKTLDHLSKAIGGLPPREQLVLTLYYYEEATMKEIENVLEMVQGRASNVHAAAVRHVDAKLADILFPKESDVYATRAACKSILPSEDHRRQPFRRCRDAKRGL